MTPKLVALSMIVHGEPFWLHIGRALQVATPEQIEAIQKMWPDEYTRFENSAHRIPLEYKAVCQLELVLRSLQGSRPTWKNVYKQAAQLNFDLLEKELEVKENYRPLLKLARRYGVSNKKDAELKDLVETAVS